MWHIRSVLFMIIASVLLAPNCAMLTRKSNQRIPVTSSPAGAKVIINGVEHGVTPLEIRLPRNGKHQVIRIESPGYNPLEISVERKVSTVMLLGDVAMGAAIGLGVSFFFTAVDILELDPSESKSEKAFWYGASAAVLALTLIDTGSGRIYSLKPRDLTVRLTKADGTPHVDTVFVDADGIQDIKWIRVYRD